MPQNANRNRCSFLSPDVLMTLATLVFACVTVFAVRDHNERYREEMTSRPETSPRLYQTPEGMVSEEAIAYHKARRRVVELLQQATELAEDKGYDGDEGAVAKINEWVDESIVLRIEHRQVEKEDIDVQIAVLQLKRALLYANLRTDAVYRDPTRWDPAEYIREM